MINSIQSLRAIAAIYVVLYHAANKLHIENGFTYLGASGVDLFFIISGFVITYTVLNGGLNWKSFIFKRLIRIVPLYWLLTLLFSALLFFMPSVFQTYHFDLIKTVFSLLFIPLVDQPVVYTGWTLSFEMYFYLLFTLSLLFRQSIAPLGVILVLLISATIGFIMPHSVLPIVQLISSELLVEFGLGMLLCYLYRSGFTFSFVISCSFIFIGLLSFLLLSEMTRLLSYGAPWFFIFVGIVFSAKPMLNNRLLLFLGDASYSIYLVHVFTLPFIQFVVKYFSIDVALYPLLYLLLYIFLGVFSGVMTFICIEQPIMKFFKKSSLLN